MTRKYKPISIGNKAKVSSTGVHGTNLRKGDIVKITHVYGSEPIYSFSVEKSSSRISKGIGYSAYSYELEPMWTNWKDQADYLREEIADMEEDIKEKKVELDIITNYKDEADYLAHKIVDILKNKDDVGAIRKLLKDYRTDIL